MAALVAAIHALTHAPTDPTEKMDARNESDGHDVWEWRRERAARCAADGRQELKAPPIPRTMVRCIGRGVRAIIVPCGICESPRVPAGRRGRAQQKETRRVGSRGAGRCPGRSASSPGAGAARAPPRVLSPPFGSAAARFVVSHLVSAYLGLSRLVSAFSAKKVGGQVRYAAGILVCSQYVPCGEVTDMAVKAASRAGAVARRGVWLARGILDCAPATRDSARASLRARRTRARATAARG